jgi:peptide/nickel transport system substrate-binding protein
MLRVTFRAGVRTGAGRPLTAHDVLASIRRARSSGARAWLTDIPDPRVETAEHMLFDVRDPARLMRMLSSPLTAIVPRTFTPEQPDGTGPFRATRRDDVLVLVRNERAAGRLEGGGPAYLDEITLRSAPDVSTSPREFERGVDDIGWLGGGYFNPRQDAVPFESGREAAWALLRTGQEATAAWDAPGVAQSLADAIPEDALRGLFVELPGGPKMPARKWGGPPCDLLVRDDSPWLVALAEKIASQLTAAGHEVTHKPVAPAEFGRRRASRAYALAIDVARRFRPGTAGAAAGLATSDDLGRAVEAVRYPPAGKDLSPRVLTRNMRVGVLGPIEAKGYRIKELVVPRSLDGIGIDFGAMQRR